MLKRIALCITIVIVVSTTLIYQAKALGNDGALGKTSSGSANILVYLPERARIHEVKSQSAFSHPPLSTSRTPQFCVDLTPGTRNFLLTAHTFTNSRSSDSLLLKVNGASHNLVFDTPTQISPYGGSSNEQCQNGALISAAATQGGSAVLSGVALVVEPAL